MNINLIVNISRICKPPYIYYTKLRYSLIFYYIMATSFLRNCKVLKKIKNNVIHPSRSLGYVVLVPEIGEDLPGNNSLLTDDGLPEFNDLTIEKCVAAVGQQSLEYENKVQEIESKAGQCKDIFEEIFHPLEKFESPLELTWGIAKTLYLGNSSLMPTKSYLGVHQRAHRARSSKFHSLPIYQAVVKDKEKLKTYSEEKERLLNKYALEGRLNGLDLSMDNRERLTCILADLQKERKVLKEKVDFATKQFSHTISNGDIVREFPEPLLKSMAADPSNAGNGPWTVTLQPHIYESFLQHCPDKKIRWNVWQAHIRRCSGYYEKSLSTSTHLEKVRGFRLDQAKLLGYDTFADMSMETKMAGSVDNISRIFEVLRESARPMQDEELNSLQAFAKDRGFDGELEHCDIPFWQRKQKRTLYNFDEEKLREYFPLPKIVTGLFNLCSKLFDIDIVERPNTHTWHKDVKFFNIIDRSVGEPVAGFYFDPYAREEEKIRIYDDAGWNVTIRNKSTINGTLPLAAMIFNFQVPMYGKPCLLSFNEVGILFHKFGHALRHLLTKVNYSEVAGLSNVEWDTADVCGHVMTHWLYDPITIQNISSHYSKEEPLPDDIIQNLHNVRSHMAGYELCKELYLSVLDLELYSKKDFWRDIVRRIWPNYHALPYDKNDAHPCSFTKIISEEWAAAYYCQIWSKMIAADIFSAFDEAKFHENDVLEVGKRYRDTFLAAGGSCHPAEVFRRFRGRDPSPQALLQNLKLTKHDVKK